nr:Ty3/gypsy retrotransposon protein [Tanacetum cinerariifolium]
MVIYQETFERLSNRVEGLPESFLVGCFIGGLKDGIRLEVKLKKPRRLVEAMGMARLVEEKNNLAREPFTPNRNVSNPEETENENPTNDALETQADEVQSEISFHAISGTILPQTLRLPGGIQNKDIVVLVNDGSTHNFMDQELVNRLGLQVDPTVNFSVVVANREKLACTVRVRNLSLVYFVIINLALASRIAAPSHISSCKSKFSRSSSSLCTTSTTAVRSPMTSVPALSPVSGALSPFCTDLIPSPKRVRDSGYLVDVEVDPRETSLRDDVNIANLKKCHL